VPAHPVSPGQSPGGCKTVVVKTVVVVVVVVIVVHDRLLFVWYGDGVDNTDRKNCSNLSAFSSSQTFS